ncbi:MAG: SAM-dependent chlorinase/fluorinase [Gemmatimonadetes bacterium]|nr:SAM-dependent chlorinase/fluorinase [Gemmatimonadota bacterium]
MTAIITLLTDFGQRDSYVAEMKGVVLSALPAAQIVDVTHDIAPGNIFAAQYVLGRTWQRFPPGTVHVVVVDPTVGTKRRVIAAAAREHLFVAPDNGLLTPVLAGARVVEVPVPAGASATFHGRDVIAPAAAMLAGGTPLERLGREIGNPIRTPPPGVRRDGKDQVGCVIYVDRFGTLVTNIEVAEKAGVAGVREVAEKSAAGKAAADAAGAAEKGAMAAKPDRAEPTAVVVAGRVVPLRRTFADVAPGELVALTGSGGTVEIAMRDGSAVEQLGVKEGAEVRLR